MDPAADQIRAVARTIAAIAAVRQIQKSFDFAKGPIADAALNAAPLVLLPPGQGSGVGGFIGSPKGMGLIAIAGITLVAQAMKIKGDMDIVTIRFSRVQQVLELGTLHKFQIDAFDANGNSRPMMDADYSCNAPQVVEVTAEGVVKPKQPGIATITAKSGEMQDMVSVEVISPKGGVPSHPARITKD